MTRHIHVVPCLALLLGACHRTPIVRLEHAEEAWADSGIQNYHYAREQPVAVAEPNYLTTVNVEGGRARARTVTDDDGVVVDEVGEQVGEAPEGYPPLTMPELHAECHALLTASPATADIGLAIDREGGLTECVVLDDEDGWTGIRLELFVPRD